MNGRRFIRRSKLAIFVAVSFFGCAYADFPQVSEQQLQVAPNVLLAGALTESGITALTNSGIMVIDLRTAQEGTAVEARQLSGLGIARTSLPIGRGISHAQVSEFDQLLKESSEQKIVVHCASGNRAGMLWAAHLIDEGVSLQKAQSQVSGIVTKDSAKDVIAAYIKR